MFPPTGFLILALQLVAAGAAPQPHPPETRAARVRTALGRSYYGLYLLVRAEISRRHGIRLRHLSHGAVYTRLQSPMADDDVRRLGRNLEWMYTLRQKADYELDPDLSWREQLEDAPRAAALARNALELARTIPGLDFSSIVSLFDRR